LVIRRVLLAKVVGVTSSGGFLVLTGFQLSHVQPIAIVFVAIHKMGGAENASTGKRKYGKGKYETAHFARMENACTENASTENARRTDPYWVMSEIKQNKCYKNHVFYFTSI